MPGLHLYSSNRLENLADIFAQILQSDPLPPLQNENVLVQSRGMARWLALATAERINIWANCNCPFPNTFINSIYKLLLPDHPDVSAYDKEYILWHIMEILPEVMQEPHLAKVAAYLQSGDDLKLYQLARETADLYDQYTLYRPQMINEWESNSREIPDGQLWQALVWNRLVERLQQGDSFQVYHRARLLQLFEKKLQNPAFDYSILPPRISVFGISSLPPYHLRVLAALAHHIDVHFFLMNPCREYWFDIVADRDIVKISRKEATGSDKLHLLQGNSLLASMGHLGRDCMGMLHEICTDEFESFADPENGSLLTNIHQDILDLRENYSETDPVSRIKKKIDNYDTSVLFHSCHSPMREVEVLYDQLLHILDKVDDQHALDPCDILVMAPDIEDYEPWIKAVFGADKTSSKFIPYSIADQSLRKSSKYIDTFLAILQLPHKKLSSVEVFSVLETEAVKRRFSITDNDLDTIEHWIHETRICWGIDGDHKKHLELPLYPENTWRAGLDRLLLGYAMPGHGALSFENILPYDDIEGNDSQLLGSFVDFTETLFIFLDVLQQTHSLAQWSEILLQAKDKLLLSDVTSESEDRVLHQLLYSLQEIQERTFFQKKIGIGVIRSFLIGALDNKFSPINSGAGSFLAGGVTFCSMLPMRAIPFKVICLLGMNEGLYPRAGCKKSFDLMAIEPKRGDRSRRFDDRYLFLETLLSARQKLSISFVGQSVQDGSRRPPSVLVSELMDYIDQHYVLQSDHSENCNSVSEHFTTMHHLQPFHPDYFSPQSGSLQQKFFSYSPENCEAAKALVSGQVRISSLFSSPLQAPAEAYKRIALNDLSRFFSHPARFLLVNRIGIAPIEESRMFETTEPFTLVGLARYKLENDILDELMRKGDCDLLYQVKKAAGDLPHGKMGEIYFHQTVSEVRSFYKTLSGLLASENFEKQHIETTLDDFTLTGLLDHVSATTLVQYRYAKLKPQDVMRVWISHLAVNAFQDFSRRNNDGMNSFYAAKDGMYKYTPAADSVRLLEEILELYWQGLQQPLYFFPVTSFAFASEICKGKSEDEALHTAIIAWEGDGHTRKGERNDPYNLLCYNDIDLASPRFKDTAKKVFLPALMHQEKCSQQFPPGF